MIGGMEMVRLTKQGRPWPAPLSDDHYRRLFMEKVSPEPNTGCWIWMGVLDENLYGRVTIRRRTITSHRAAWILFRGFVGGRYKIVVDHKCRQHWCVNPDHLEPVTYRENSVVRGMGKLQIAHRAGICTKGHKMVPRKNKPTQHRCLVCQANYDKARPPRRKAK